jgi:hypothetical protein
VAHELAEGTGARLINWRALPVRRVNAGGRSPRGARRHIMMVKSCDAKELKLGEEYDCRNQMAERSPPAAMARAFQPSACDQDTHSHSIAPLIEPRADTWDGSAAPSVAY